MRSRIAILVLSAFMFTSVGVVAAAAAPAPSQTAAAVAETAEGMKVMAEVAAQQAPQLAGPIRAACDAATGSTSPDVDRALSVLSSELATANAGVAASGFSDCLLKGLSFYRTCMKWIRNSRVCGYAAGARLGVCLYDLYKD